MEAQANLREHPIHKNYLCGLNGEIYSKRSKRFINPVKMNTGYLSIQVGNKKILAHRFIMQAHYGISSLYVNHIDGNRANNCIKNLEYVTHSENLKHAYRIGLAEQKLKGEKSPVAITSELQVLTLITLLNAGKQTTCLYRSMGYMTEGSVKGIREGRSWKHLNFLKD